MGGIRDRQSKRYAARPGERWSRHQGRREGRKVFPEGNPVKLRDFRPRGQIYVCKAAKDHTRRH